MQECRIAFVGAGSIARAHAFALAALPYYYADTPKIIRVAVASITPNGRRNFATRHGFSDALSPEELWRRDDIDTVFILAPNEVHYLYLKNALEMKSVRRVYIEKPICVTKEEERNISELIANAQGSKVIQAGFQYLQMAAVRRALMLWRSGSFGPAIHFQARYLHSGYLERSYRDARPSRLKAAPEGGAVADLGSHVFSLLISFLGEELEVVAARQSGAFPDVIVESDLCSVLLLRDQKTGAIGTVTASRISAGADELLELELRAARGSLSLSTEAPDVLKVFDNESQKQWVTMHCGSDYSPASQFPSRHTSAGWLRSLIHAHYLFFGGSDPFAILPDTSHALAVQRLIRTSAQQLTASRSLYSNQ